MSAREALSEASFSCLNVCATAPKDLAFVGRCGNRDRRVCVCVGGGVGKCARVWGEVLTVEDVGECME